jgi:hypothetical protein
MALRFGTGTRRAALDGLTRILDAGALEELFTGSDDDAAFVYDLLVEVARGRSSSCYWEICRTARRRGVTPEYVIDRATVLLGSIEERRRIDAYRILGVASLASPEAIRHGWIEFAKRGHPDVGGDPAQFRRVKGAYELLRDPQRRAEYERYWLRALGPFERVVPREPEVGPLRTREAPPERRLAMVVKRGALIEAPAPAADPPGIDGRARATEAPAAPAASAVPAPDATPPADEPVTVSQVLGRVRGIVHQIDAGELAALRQRVTREIAELEGLRDTLAAVAAIKRRLPGA